MARSENQERLGVARLDQVPGLKHQRFLAGHGAGGHQNRPALSLPEGGFQGASKLSELRRLGVKFQISNHPHALRLGAELAESFRVLFRLRADLVHVGQHAPHEGPRQPITAQRPL